MPTRCIEGVGRELDDRGGDLRPDEGPGLGPEAHAQDAGGRRHVHRRRRTRGRSDLLPLPQSRILGHAFFFEKSRLEKFRDEILESVVTVHCPGCTLSPDI